MSEITDNHPAMVGAREAIRSRRTFRLRVIGAGDAIFYASCTGDVWTMDSAFTGDSAFQCRAADVYEAARVAVATRGRDSSDVRAFSRGRCATVSA